MVLYIFSCILHMDIWLALLGWDTRWEATDLALFTTLYAQPGAQPQPP
jgi:hypothetical protein